jgi:hypothetical protein
MARSEYEARTLNALLEFRSAESGLNQTVVSKYLKIRCARNFLSDSPSLRPLALLTTQEI